MIKRARIIQILKSSGLRYIALLPIFFFLSLSLTSLVLAIANYHRVSLPAWSLWLVFLLIFCSIYKHLKINELIIGYKDIAIIFIGLIPYVLLPLLSPLPLGDDIRYIAWSRISPNGILVLSGYIVITSMKLFHLNVFMSYWIIAFSMLISYCWIIIYIFKNIFKLRGTLLYIAFFSTLFSLNTLTLLLFRVFIHEPYKYTYIIYRVNGLGPLGRANGFYFTLKYGSIVLVLLPILIRRYKAILASLLHVLAFVYYPMYTIYTLPIATILYSLKFGKKILLKMFMKYMIATYALMTLLSWSTNPLYFSLLAINRKMSYVINPLYVITPLIVGIIIFLVTETMIKRWYIFLLYLLIISIVPIALTNIKFVNIFDYNIHMGFITFYNYYMLIPFIIYFIFNQKIANMIIKTLNEYTSILALTIYYTVFLLIISAIYVLMMYIRNSLNVVTIYYVGRILRLIWYPGMTLALSIIFFSTLRNIVRKAFLRDILLVILAFIVIINASFNVLYWGYYQRNPWASGPYNADDMNIIIRQIEPLVKLLKEGDHMVAYGYPAVIVYDIVAMLKTGMPTLTPVTAHIFPYTVLRSIPMIILVDSKHPVCSILEELEEHGIVKRVATIKFAKEVVYAFMLHGRSDNKIYVKGPIPLPDLAPNYFKKIALLQHILSNSTLVFNWSNAMPYYNVDIVATDKIYIRPNATLNLKKVLQKGYNYIVGVLPAKEGMSIRLLVNGKSRKLSFVPYPRLRVGELYIAISIKQLEKLYGTGSKIKFINLENISLCKDLVIYLRQFNVEHGDSIMTIYNSDLYPKREKRN